MPKTWGYYQIETRLLSLRAWPKPNKFGIEVIILIIINAIWALHPYILEITSFGTNINKFLFHTLCYMEGITLFSVIIQIWSQKHNFFDLVNRMSDFSTFGVPKRMRNLDKLVTKVLKIFRKLNFISIFLISNAMMFDKTCATKRELNKTYSSTCNLLFEYYVPFNVNTWLQTIMMLFQMFSAIIMMESLCTLIIFYYYTVELLIIRIEDFSRVVADTKFDGNNLENKQKLKHILLYHQNIVGLFEIFTSITKTLVVPQRFCAIVAIIVSLASFFYQPNINPIMVSVQNFCTLLVLHAIGQRLTDKSLTIPEAIYNMKWYEADVNTQKNILTSLCIIQKPFIVNFNIFGTLSFPKMTEDVKSIYAWFNYLWNTSFKK